MAICVDCAKNRHLKKRIAEDGVHAYCIECGQNKRKVFGIDRLADVISQAVQENFELNAQRYFLDDGDGNDITEPYGDALHTVVAEMLEQDVVFFDKLIEAISETSEHDFMDGEPDYFEPGAVYVPYRWDWTSNHFGSHWNRLISELKHKRRFFSESVNDFFERLFENVDKIRASDDGKSVPVVEVIFPHEPMFRARVIELEDVQKVINEPYKLIGPAPRNKARSGRMSPEGVVALYCARDAATAMAELRPAIGSVVAVVTIVATRPLRILNFERLERAADEGWGAYLARDYDTVYNTRVFLRNLHSLISQPVIPGHESDYLITQTMAEYLAHVYQPNFDGIIFKSVQRSGGVNLVLFAEKGTVETEAEIFPVEYVKDSVSFNKIDRVEYNHSPMQPTFNSASGVSLSAKLKSSGTLVSNLKLFKDK